MVDTLDDVGQGSVELTATVSDGMPFVTADGRLDNAAFLEMIAQGIAAMNAFEGRDGSSTSHNGFLVGARNLEIREGSRRGDVLKIRVEEYAKLGEFGVSRGEITRGDEVLASGMVTVWAKET